MFYKTEIHWYKLFDSISEAENTIEIGRALTKQIAGKRLCIARTVNGFFAVSDKCPHNGFSLGKGVCTNDDVVVCPLHRYGFDLKTGRSKGGGYAGYVNTFPLKNMGSGLYVGIEKKVLKLFG